MPDDSDIFQPGIGWVPVSQRGKLPASYDPVRAREYVDRGLPPAGPLEKNVFGERGVTIQGSPLTAAEQSFWRANPMGAIPDPRTGNLIGLGQDELSRRDVIQSAFPAASTVVSQPRTQVDSDALINQAVDRRQELEAQRGGLENERAKLIQKYGSLPRGMHGRDTAQHRSILQQLHGLDAQERDLHSQELFADHESSMRLSAAFRNADIAGKNLEFQRKEQTARDAAGMMSALSVIESRYQHGTPEFRQALLDAEGQYPMWIHHAGTAAAVRKAAEFHDTQQTKMENKLGTQLFERTGLTPEQFAAIPRESVRAGIMADAQGKDVGKMTTAGVSFPTDATFKGVDKGPVTEINVGGNIVRMPTSTYDAYRRAFGFGNQTQQPAATPAGNRVRRYNPETGQIE